MGVVPRGADPIAPDLQVARASGRATDGDTGGSLDQDAGAAVARRPAAGHVGADGVARDRAACLGDLDSILLIARDIVSPVQNFL
jgi:hypothetical protein